MVAKGHKITNVPLFKKLWDIIFCFGDNPFMSHFSGHFEGAKTFYVLLPYISYVMEAGRFSQCPAFLSRTAKERD